MATKKKIKPTIKDVIKSFNKMYKSGLAATAPTTASLKRLKEFHPSSSPYCGLRHAYSLMTDGGPVFESETNAMMDYYCRVGTTVHEVLQQWLSQVSYDDVYIIGDWLCTNRDCGHKEEFSSHLDCPKCGHAMLYEELGIEYGHRTVGHVDTLLHVRIDGHEYHIVVDYKTTSSLAIWQHNKKPKFPYSHNVFQIETYVALLEHKYPDLKIDGWLLVYISRDNPSTIVPTGQLVDEDRKVDLRKQIKSWDKQYNYVYNKIRHDFPLDTLKPLVKHKLCHSHDFYTTQVKGYNECPLSKVCFNKSKLVGALKEAHAEMGDVLPPTTVVHCKRDEYDQYIGRAHKSGLAESIYSNPFVIGVDGDREQVLIKYRKWLEGEITVKGKRPPTLEEILMLKGYRLGCWCVSEKDPDIECHGHILAEICDQFVW